MSTSCINFKFQNVSTFNEVDNETLHGLFESSTYRVHEFLTSVRYKVFGDENQSPSEISFGITGYQEVTGESLTIEEEASFFYGKCAVIRHHGLFNEMSYLEVKTR